MREMDFQGSTRCAEVVDDDDVVDVVVTTTTTLSSYTSLSALDVVEIKDSLCAEKVKPFSTAFRSVEHAPCAVASLSKLCGEGETTFRTVHKMVS